MEPENTKNNEEREPEHYKSRVDTRPLTANEQALWWVLGAMGLFSMLLLVVLMALFHSPMAAN